MNEWISVKDKVPPIFEVVWVYWRDREVLLACKMDGEGTEPSENWYSFEDEKCRWAHWWIPVNEYTWDKPKPPEE